MSRYSDSLLQPVILLTFLGLIMVYSASMSPFSDNISGLQILVNQFKSHQHRIKVKCLCFTQLEIYYILLIKK